MAAALDLSRQLDDDERIERETDSFLARVQPNHVCMLRQLFLKWYLQLPWYRAMGCHFHWSLELSDSNVVRILTFSIAIDADVAHSGSPSYKAVAFGTKTSTATTASNATGKKARLWPPCCNPVTQPCTPFHVTILRLHCQLLTGASTILACLKLYLKIQCWESQVLSRLYEPLQDVLLVQDYACRTRLLFSPIAAITTSCWAAVLWGTPPAHFLSNSLMPRLFGQKARLALPDSLQIICTRSPNKGYASKLHRDRNNAGPSVGAHAGQICVGEPWAA